METLLSAEVTGAIKDIATTNFKDFLFFLLDFPLFKNLITILYSLFPIIKIQIKAY